MEVLSVKDLSFQYEEGSFALHEINFQVKRGQMTLLCGPCGCGKTTLLRLLKQELRPAGHLSGDIINVYSSDKVGYLFQHPDHQIVCQTVEEELVFGAENLGMSTEEISRGLAEITAYLGLENIMKAKTSELSGGQKQFVNLASILLMKPKMLLLDEPVSQLDPVSAYEFLMLLKKLKDELNLTIIIIEHNLNLFLNEADQIIFLDQGKLDFQGDSQSFIKYILETEHLFRYSLPETVKIYLEQAGKLGKHFDEKYPLTVNELIQQLNIDELKQVRKDRDINNNQDQILLIKKGYFKYQKNEPDILSDMNLSIQRGKILALIGANGAGKSTLYSVLSGYKKMYKGKLISDVRISVLPQNPMVAFFKDNLYEDFRMIADKQKIEEMIEKYDFCKGIRSFLHKNPLDLSGGQMQKAAIIKMLLTDAELLLLDEPVKGMDGYEKYLFSQMLEQLTQDGKTIMYSTHDLEFTEKTADQCMLLFQGKIIADTTPAQMFGDNRFYTTVRGRLRGIQYEL